MKTLVTHLSKAGLGALFLALVASACATTRVAMTTADLLDQADSVVLATCTQADFRRDPNSLMGQSAYYTFEVEDRIKGEPALSNGMLELRLGGVSEASTPFIVGDRLILFLGQTNRDGYTTLYGSESTMLRVESMNARFPHPALQGRAVIKGTVTGFDGVAGNPQVTLQEFLEVAHRQVRAKQGELQ